MITKQGYFWLGYLYQWIIRLRAEYEELLGREFEFKGEIKFEKHPITQGYEVWGRIANTLNRRDSGSGFGIGIAETEEEADAVIQEAQRVIQLAFSNQLHELK